MHERKLTRREAVAKLFAGLATGGAWPLIASAHPLHEHLKNAALLDRADDADRANGWKPLFLDAKQNDALVALAETMVPGSTKARVNRFIDLLLSVDTREHQRQFLESLAAVEAAAKKRFGRGFPALSEDERDALLTGILQNEFQRPHFGNLKEWIAGAYYSSEEGMRELGWDGNRAFAKFPGCAHGEGAHARRD